MPKSKSLRWLTDAGKDVPADVRLRFMSGFFASAVPIFIGALALISVNVAAVIRHPTAIFGAVLAVDATLLLVRISILLQTHRAMRRGKLKTPDLFLASGIAWTVLVGASTALCVASRDPVLQFLAPTTMMGIVAGLVTRNNCAPRLAVLQVALCDVPLQFAVPFCGQPWMIISIAQCPLLLAAMTKTVFGISRAYLAVVMAKLESEERATHDPLTGLWNRSGLMSALSRATRGGSTGTGIALLYVDLDGFKAVNDLLGHAAGDDLIRKAAVRISDSVPDAALVARLGGDEFIIVAPGQDERGALVIGNAVIAAISRPYELGAHCVPRIGASIGIACSDRVKLPDDLLADADAALYQAKNAGKGHCVIAGPHERSSIAKAPLAA